ncbi:MAG: hypothetical protein KGI50_01785 [Patescibacteria group bacterium]|nr:hypothetical protein [Patescibacteria group bacterium]MDE2437925.1 hypothetical protein [Patescibacteria group bacterium]
MGHYKKYFSNKDFLTSLGIGVVLFVISLFVNIYAGTYATVHASNAVNDIILDNIPVFNLGDVFVYGPVIFWIFVTIICIREPKRIPFVLKSIALFVFIRSFFVTLTHIGPYPTEVAINYNQKFVKDITFGGDLFFSGHTGLPFLMALIFWDHKYLRVIFTLTAVFFGVVVLLAHLHYSIDVLSAFFITYSISHIARVLFAHDRALFRVGIER